MPVESRSALHQNTSWVIVEIPPMKNITQMFFLRFPLKKDLNEDRTGRDKEKEEKQLDNLKGLRAQGSREL
jgi:hypothetical protein